MKKIALFALMSVFSTAAISDTTGTLAPSATGAQQTMTATQCDMIAGTNTFELKLSSNVGMSWSCSPTAAAVIAGSIKGKYVYGGGTSGGGVHQCSATVDTSTGYSGTVSSAEGNGC